MATEKILNTRIGLKVDTLENWGKSTLPLKKGEVAFATVAATAGNGLSEPVVMMKIGEDGVKTFKDIEWNFYAKASDVLASAKSEDALRTFINGVIADAGIASSEAMEALAGRVTTTEGAIATLNGNDETAGSVAKSIKDAIAALNLDTTYVAIEDGKSLVSNTEITKLAGISAEAKKVEASETNGNIKIDGVETVVYTHPNKHTIDDVTGLQDALDGKQAAGDYAAEDHTHVKADITDFAHTHTVSEVTDFVTEVARVKVANATMADEATKATQDSNGKVIAETYAEKATTLAGYGIGDAYTKTETEGKISEAITTFTNAYITSDGGAIDKLQEIADWIDSDKNGAADVIADIEANAEGIENLSGRMDAAEDAIEAIDNHSHENKTVLDGITAEKVSAWDAAEQNAKDYADGKVSDLAEGQVKTNKEAIDAINDETTGILAQAKADAANKGIAILAEAQKYADQAEADAIADAAGKYETKGTAQGIVDALDLANTYQAKGDYATAEQGDKADTAIQSVDSVAGNGIKATTSGTAVTIDWDPEVVFVFDCGTSEE